MKKTTSRYCAVLLAFLCICQIGFSQITVRGTVKDINGNPIIGATVLEKGTTRGAITDENGEFAVDLIGDAATLVFSYLGYSTEERAVDGDNTVVDLVLEEDIARLDEVVITGLASAVKRSNSGNAIASVTAEELTGKTRQQTLDGALFGKVPGVQMSSNSGAPGGGISMQLRGVSTLGAGSSQPLFIIDGVYVDNSVIRTGRTQVNGASGGQNAATQDDASNRIADLNPQDIEKIEVLKGPSAAAIYGTRANAGLLLSQPSAEKREKPPFPSVRIWVSPRDKISKNLDLGRCSYRCIFRRRCR